MKKFTTKELEIVKNMLEKRKNSLVDTYRKTATQGTNAFSKFSTFFATTNPGYSKKS